MFSTADNEDISQVTSLKDQQSNSSSDAQEPAQIAQTAKPQNRELTLKMLVKELVFCMALALTTYGALHNTPTKISKHPQAERFFDRQSLVTDWYKGQLTKALTAINHADVAFVMYYAPWDAECQHVRGQFELVASVLSDRVHFSAINCWHPGSECRLQHSKIPSWPVIMVYTVNSRGVLYKGPKDAHSMVKFLELIMRPLRRVSSAEDLIHLLSICEAVAVGYTPITETPKYYNIWNGVALQSREYDTFGEICFASVVSEELASDLGVDVMPHARFMLWNETKEYDGDIQTWNESALIKWLMGHFAQPVDRVVPLWKKGFNFERHANGNPILILFTPINPLFEMLPVFSLLREIAMEYYNCNNNQWIKEMIKLQYVQRLLYQQKNVKKFCQQSKLNQYSKKPSNHFNYEVFTQQNKLLWTNSTVKSKKSGLFGFLLKRDLAISNALKSGDDETILPSINLIHECSVKVLPAEKTYYEKLQICHTSENIVQYEKDDLLDFETTMLPSPDDPLSANRLIEDHVKHFCKLMKFAYERGAPVHPAKESNDNVTHVHGLGCAANFTLNMVAVDSIENYHFAESLGIDIVNKKDLTALIILDSKHESQYVLTEDFGAKSVRDFIINFTNKKLQRSLRTRVDDELHTHFFESDNKETSTTAEDLIEITDLTTNTFREFVKTPGNSRLVAVCGGACPARAAAAALRAARLLAARGLRLRLARLDALRHDLPWHYTPPAYPALLVFPADGDSELESRVYPCDQRVTAAGVIALVLQSLAAPQRLRVRLALCAMVQTNNEKLTCLSELKQHVTSLIGSHLRYWRRFDDVHFKNIVLKRLQILNNISFQLGLLHISDVNEKSIKQNNLISSISALDDNWHFDNLLLRKNSTQRIIIEDSL